MSVKLGSSRAHRRVALPDELDRVVGVDELAAFTDIAERFVPDLMPDPVRTAAFMEAYSADRHPVVGMMPDHPGVVMLAAFSGDGFKLSPAMGEIAADFALTGSTAHPVDVFSPLHDLKPFAYVQTPGAAGRNPPMTFPPRRLRSPGFRWCAWQ